MNNKIYIAGPVTGHADWESNFKAAEAFVESVEFFNRHCSSDLYYKYGKMSLYAVSPREFSRPKSSWKFNMVICLWHLLFCTHAYFLKGWETSRGASIEHRFAMFLCKKIFYEKGAKGYVG